MALKGTLDSNKTKENMETTVQPEQPTMTTKSSRPLSDDQIKEVLEAMNNGTLRKPQAFSSDYEGSLADSNIDAISLTPPSVERIKYKKPELIGRWVHKEGDGSGVGVGHWEAQGFVLATPDDVEVSGLRPKEGHYYFGSLVLMVVSRARLSSAIKAKDKRAHDILSPANRLRFGNQMLQQAIDEGGDARVKGDNTLSSKDRQHAREQAGQLPGKLSVFNPAIDEGR